MNSLSRDVAEHIGAVENEAVARFYDHVGLGNMYRAAVSGQGIKQVIAQFTKRGYETTRIPIGAEKNDTLRYQMLLLHEGREVARQDIKITTAIGDIVEVMSHDND